MDNKNIYELLESEITEADIPAEEKYKQLSKLFTVKGQKINLMLVGAAGSGKSSTINSILNNNMAKVGIGVEPETKDIECYQFENFTIWDTPGIGDKIESNSDDSYSVTGYESYSEQIEEKLFEYDDNRVPIIDLALVVIDGSTKDLSSTYELITDILVPKLKVDRIIIAVNQADVAMKGNHWDTYENCPDDMLNEFLEKKCSYIKSKIFEATNLEFTPMYYSAGYTNENGIQNKPYNITKLLHRIILSLPDKKRPSVPDPFGKSISKLFGRPHNL